MRGREETHSLCSTLATLHEGAKRLRVGKEAKRRRVTNPGGASFITPLRLLPELMSVLDGLDERPGGLLRGGGGRPV